MSIPVRFINDKFLSKLENQEEKDKLASATGNYIRDRLREVCFVDKVLEPKPVTRNECQVSVNHDTLVKIIELEPQSRAMALTFRGQPTTRIIRAPRMEAAFWTISSEKYEKTEQELLAYEMPVTKIIEENVGKDMQEIKDREFLRHGEAAVQALQKEANSNVATALKATTYASVKKRSIIKGERAVAAGVDDFTVHPALKTDYIELFKLMDGTRLRLEKIVMTEVDYDDLSSWTLQDVGSKMATETTVEGYKYNSINGRKIIRTIKTDILRPGNIYGFAAEDFLGRSYILNTTKFYIDKIVNVITWQAWMDVCLAIVNVAGIVKLELYGGSVTTDAEDVGYEDKLPMEEDQLGAVNNRVDQGLKFPDIIQY